MCIRDSSDAVLDAILAKEAELEAKGYIAPNGQPAKLENVRCACETFVTTGTVIVAGEIRTEAYIDVQNIAREVVDVYKRQAQDRAMPMMETAVRVRLSLSERAAKRLNIPGPEPSAEGASVVPRGRGLNGVFMSGPPLVAHDAAVLDGDYAVGHEGDVLIVGDDDERLLELPV